MKKTFKFLADTGFWLKILWGVAILFAIFLLHMIAIQIPIEKF